MSFPYDRETSLVFPNVQIYHPKAHFDLRGEMWTNYQDSYHCLPAEEKFRISKFTRSTKNVLRGLHSDSSTWKLISCIYGKSYRRSDYFLGLQSSGKVNLDCVHRWVRKANLARTYEVGFHMGRDNEELESTLHWKEIKYKCDWETELAAATSETLRRWIKASAPTSLSSTN